MSGYSWKNGMSNNAVNAYESGLKPLSKITREDLEHAGVDEALGYKCSMKFAKYLVKTDFWCGSEWHHTSKMYNKTEFYDPEALKEAIESAKEFNEFDNVELRFRFDMRKNLEQTPEVVIKNGVLFDAKKLSEDWPENQGDKGLHFENHVISSWKITNAVGARQANDQDYLKMNASVAKSNVTGDLEFARGRIEDKANAVITGIKFKKKYGHSIDEPQPRPKRTPTPPDQPKRPRRTISPPSSNVHEVKR